MSTPLPNVYTSITDISQLPQGAAGDLAVGINIKSKKGPIGPVPTLITSAQDLLTIFTFQGKVLPTDDTSFFTALNILKQTSLLYVGRAYSVTNPPLYGGLVVKTTGQPVPFDQVLLGAITGYTAHTITLSGNLVAFFAEGDKIIVSGSTLAVDDGTYTVVSAAYTTDTVVTVVESIPDLSPVALGSVHRGSIVNPNNYKFQSDDLYIITGKDPGAYNSNIAVKQVSSVDNAPLLPESNVVQLTIINTLTNAVIESPYLFNTTLGSKALDGTSLYITDVLSNSNYIAVTVNPANPLLLPVSTTSNASLTGGTDGDVPNDSDMSAALALFEDKIVPIDIMANGSVESPVYQSALLNLAITRADCVAFINSRLSDELANTNSQRATNVATYKSSTLSSTSFYGAMYAPHVTIPDLFNSRQVTVGFDAIAIPGWLSVISNQGYPFAYAGYENGTATNATATWKIGDESGAAKILNDASVNFMVYDPIQGVYVVWTQNTLQIANSALKNLGAVFNILDIKRTLSLFLKQFLQLPITNSLRKNIKDNVDNYMDGIKANNRVGNYLFQDLTTTTDVSNNTIRLMLTISPAYYAQQIYLSIEIVNATFNFQILQSL